MAEVFSRAIGPPGRKLTLLSLADYASDDGGSVFPSLQTLALKASLSRDQVQRYVRSFIADGLLSVVANGKGGHHSNTTVYRVNLDKLRALPPWKVNVTGSTDAHDGGHARLSRGAPMPATGGAYAPQSIIESSEEKETARKLAAPGAFASQGIKSKSAIKGKRQTFADWQAEIKARGEVLIPADDPIYELAHQISLLWEMLEAHAQHFQDTYLIDKPDEVHHDWRCQLRRSVRSNWFKLWRHEGPTGSPPDWTPAGKQARAAMSHRAPDDAPTSEAAAPPRPEPEKSGDRLPLQAELRARLADLKAQSIAHSALNPGPRGAYRGLPAATASPRPETGPTGPETDPLDPVTGVGLPEGQPGIGHQGAVLQVLNQLAADSSCKSSCLPAPQAPVPGFRDTGPPGYSPRARPNTPRARL